MSFFQSRAFKILLAAAGLLFAASIGAGILFYLTFFRDLPDLRNIEDYQPALASRIYDRNGLVVGSFYEERRTLAPMTSIPRHVVQAFVAGEDSTFFTHAGIDYRSILRAAWVNLRAGGEIRQGASTITQQMVKGLLLTPERKFRRKIREMILARQIEQHFSKQEILYLYLNQIYFGHGAYGIREAARTYFGKDTLSLTVSEGALLAGLPKAPSRYSPFSSREEAEKRRRYVLTRMHEEGYLDKAGYAAALAELPALADVGFTRSDPAAAYFKEEVRRYLIDQLGAELVMRGGLTVETTLDIELQHAGVSALQQGLIDLDHRQGYRGPLRRVAALSLSDELHRLAEVNQLAPEEQPAMEPTTEPTTTEPTTEPTIDAEPSEKPDPAAWASARSALDKKGGWLLGLVVAVDGETNTARVSFAPGIEGVVALEDVRWAREPDSSRRPYSVKSIDAVFVVGDVTRFSALAPEKQQEVPLLEPDTSPLRLTIHQVPEVQGALLSIDLASQEVLTMVGGYDFEKSQFNRATQARRQPGSAFKPIIEKSQFNRATQARRQPGSAFKPIIYAASLAQDYTPATIVFDRPVVYTDEESGFIWRPRNYKRSFYGPITIREALARSVNNATVHLFRDVGVDFVIDYARKLGIESPLSRDLSLALGSSGVSLMEITRAYGVFAAGGRRVVPTFIRRVTDRDGKVLVEEVALGATGGEAIEETEVVEAVDAATVVATPFGEEPPPDPNQVISPEEAFLATTLLQAVVEDPRGTGHRLRVLRTPLGGKTGTTNDQADAWFVGFSPDIATGVWVGHDETRFLGYGETGSRAAAPIWVAYMKAALRDRPKRNFPVPEGIEFARIDRKTGLLAQVGAEETVFQAFREGTVPTKTAASARSDSESRRELRLDSF